MASSNWRTINIDLLEAESPANFDTKTLLPPVSSVSASEVQSLASQIRQLSRGGDSEGALRGALENAPYGGDGSAKVPRIGFMFRHPTEPPRCNAPCDKKPGTD